MVAKDAPKYLGEGMEGKVCLHHDTWKEDMERGAKDGEKVHSIRKS